MERLAHTSNAELAACAAQVDSIRLELNTLHDLFARPGAGYGFLYDLRPTGGSLLRHYLEAAATRASFAAGEYRRAMKFKPGSKRFREHLSNAQAYERIVRREISEYREVISQACAANGVQMPEDLRTA